MSTTVPTRWRVVALLVVAAGLVVGLVGAVAIPRTSAGSAAAPVDRRVLQRVAGPVTEAAPRQPAAEDAREIFSKLDVEAATLRTERTQADPAGGPDWVVRSFDAEESYTGALRGRDAGRSTARHCVQLGRELRGRFGWIDGDAVFRPVLPDEQRSAPTQCRSRGQSRRGRLTMQLTTLVAHPTRDDRAVLGSVLWGTTGKPARRLVLNAAGRTDAARQGPGGGFVALYGPQRTPADAVATVSRRGRDDSRHSLYEAPSLAEGMGTALSGARQIIARTPDPAGGPTIGLTGVKTESGAWCVGEHGPVVDDRIGTIDPQLGTMWEQYSDYLVSGCSQGDPFPPGQAINFGSSFRGETPGEELLAPGRGALRLQPGRSAIHGIAKPEVELITFASSRDIRTIAPTGPAHAFIVVWDGDFASSGSVTITQHLRDGSRRVFKQDLSF